MPTEPYRPIIFISYAHGDEPEKPAADEIKWLSFVTGYLRPAVKPGAVEIWIDRLMRGGDDWDPEIERRLRACDIFILLVSRHSLSSPYVVDREVVIIRERQAKGEDVHFYPLVLTPTPKIALELVRDKNLRPRDGKPFSDYSINERYRHMSEAADEIAEIAGEIAERKALVVPPPAPAADSPREPVSRISDGNGVAAWLREQSIEGSIAIAARAALRVLHVVVKTKAEQAGYGAGTHQFSAITSAVFRATAVARVAGKYPTRINELRVAADAAVRATADAADTARTAFNAELYAVARAADAARAAARSVATAGAENAASAAVVHAAEWEETRADLAALQMLGASTLADAPLWSSAPEWTKEAGADLRAHLPKDEDWEVWVDWYEERLRGGSSGERYELAFASVPLEVWHQGAAAANAWIRAHLPKRPEATKSVDLPEPLPELESPFTYSWNANWRVTIVAGAQNLPFYRFFKSEEEHRQSLERCRVSAERLLESLRDGRYGNAVRREYAERLNYYLNDLPKIAGVGNIMLADDEVRVLYAMFAQDAEALPSPFAAALARVIANQFALNDFYEVVRRHEQAVNEGNWTQPFPFGPAKRFFGAVDEYTPRIFEPEVGEGLHRVERASPPVTSVPAASIAPSSAIQLPTLPTGAPNAEQSREHQIATAANALWRVFLKGKDLPVAIEGWTQAAHKLGENIGPILDFLGGLGTPL